MIISEAFNNCPDNLRLFSNPLTTDPYYLKTLSNGKNPIYLIMLGNTGIELAMKVFEYQNNKISSSYSNEARFGPLCHVNIISIQNDNPLLEIFDCKGNILKYSYILMEYARYGDLFDAVVTKKIPFDDILARTYFHQLIKGIEYLHQNGVAHLDLKPENILIGENFVLKIGDFDLSFINGDNNIRSMGTKCYRAPEIAYQTSENPFFADIYSLGIVLFFLLTHGEIPSVDSNNVAEEFTFQEVLQTNNRKYWRDFSRSVQVDSSYFSKDFKFLFERMVHPDPKKRPSLFDVKNSKWYNGRILSKKELEIFMGIYYPTTSQNYQCAISTKVSQLFQEIERS